MSHIHAWTARALLHDLHNRQQLLNEIRRELLELKTRIDQIEDLDQAGACKQALKQLWDTFSVVVDVEAKE